MRHIVEYEYTFVILKHSLSLHATVMDTSLTNAIVENICQAALKNNFAMRF